jgi:pre-mRNA cleavage complex 2 protein Pcf11
VVPPTPEQQAGVNVETLSSDIQNMIVATKAEASLSPHDASVQTKLRALLDLQGIVQSQSLPQDQLELIKNEVTKLAGVKLGPQNSSSTAILTHTPPPPAAAAQQQQQFVPPPAPSSVTPSPAPPAAAGQQGSLTLDSLLGAGALATLMGRTSSQNSTPNPPNAAIRSPQPAQATPYAAPPAQPPTTLSLVEQLRLAGLIQPTTPTNAGAVAAPPPPAPTVTPNLASLLAAQQAPVARPHSRLRRGLNSASLKQP